MLLVLPGSQKVGHRGPPAAAPAAAAAAAAAVMGKRTGAVNEITDSI